MLRVRTLVVTALICCACIVGFSAGQEPPGEAEIRAIVEAQARAWDAGDVETYAKNVAPDMSFTNLFGMVMYGEAVELMDAFADGGG